MNKTGAERIVAMMRKSAERKSSGLYLAIATSKSTVELNGMKLDTDDLIILDSNYKHTIKSSEGTITDTKSLDLKTGDTVLLLQVDNDDENGFVLIGKVRADV